MVKSRVARPGPVEVQQPNVKDASFKQTKRKEAREAMVMKGLFGASIIIPQVILLSLHKESEVGPSPFHMYREMVLSLARMPHFLSDSSFLLVCFLLSLQNISYTLVWVRSQAFTQFCKRNKLGNPVDVVVAIFLANKTLQLIAPAVWYFSIASIPSLSNLTTYQVGTAIQFIAIGQLFNIAIYQAIGKAGVYYGTRLGKSIPWVSGFPFNVISHPQYCGVVMTVFGLVVLLHTSVHCQSGLFGLFVVQTLLYVAMGLVEQFF